MVLAGREGVERALDLLKTTFDRRMTPREGPSVAGRLPMAKDALEFLQASEIQHRSIQSRRRRRRTVVLTVSLIVAVMMSGRRP